ncbi:hypothetical protein GOEFS_035_00920 [Gordonia effusa NBRC 100432]|uniref:DUF4247 domain-containing protein n=1 Tax=Gordonia effusa NBRC 100432 TaxID=1077974 RepID=H0QXK9_9ACTN|nr:DUF4247 domain-containing protein [Gordonia effusa]GAB17560.1 hypothetical protein GOEFS_035_00920 [Gordonia effusa NBRC 100432]
MTTPDPRRKLFIVRNIIVGVIVLIAGLLVIGSCGSGSTSARNYISGHYQRDASLDEANQTAYIADGTPDSVASAISNAERPTDNRSGATTAGNISGTRFLQYPDYLVALFPYAAGKSKVMLSKDYTSGYHHYHNYVGGYWVPTPHYSGSGSGNRGGGSGSGK